MKTTKELLDKLEDVAKGPSEGESEEEFVARAKKIGEEYKEQLEAGTAEDPGPPPEGREFADQFKVDHHAVEDFKSSHAAALKKSREQNTKVAVAGLSILAAGGIAVAIGGINVGSIITAAKNAADAVRELIFGDGD